MNNVSLRLPNWPPPEGEDVGIDRAREYVAWIREHAGPVLAEAERYPEAETHRAGTPVGQLATWGLDPRMKGLSIGCVWCDFMAGTFAMVDIVITREGELIAKPGLNMR